jgi:hypothetical protein
MWVWNASILGLLSGKRNLEDRPWWQRQQHTRSRAGSRQAAQYRPHTIQPSSLALSLAAVHARARNVHLLIGGLWSSRILEANSQGSLRL